MPVEIFPLLLFYEQMVDEKSNSGIITCRRWMVEIMDKEIHKQLEIPLSTVKSFKRLVQLKICQETGT